MRIKLVKILSSSQHIWSMLRISLGLIFFWSFIDKVFGLGFSTCRLDSGQIDYGCESAWIAGGSPTEGFLKFGTKGPFQDGFASMAGNPFIDWLFMLGLAGAGIGLLLGIAIKLSAIAGILLMFSIYLASAVWPEFHPFLDEHVVYILILIGVMASNQKQKLGFGQRWKRLGLVKKFTILE